MARASLRWNPGSAVARVGGAAPAAPTAVTSITQDSGAIVSFLPSASGSPTSYTVTPYIGASAQTPTTVAAGSTGSIVASNGSTYRQITVSGLTNSTAYTFTVKGSNGAGAGPESAASGANTPLSGLVFGDDFNGPAGQNLDPEWWVLNRCGYLAQSEVQYYLPAQCVLDGSGRLLLTAANTSTSGPRYASDPSFPGTVTQPWRSGACQSNTRTFAPSTGNTMVFEARQQVCADAGNGFWPGLFWLSGQTWLTSWKTDPLQTGWDSTGQAELDVAEWFNTGDANTYGNVSWAGTNESHSVTSTTLATAMHTYRCEWKPGVTVRFYLDGSLTYTSTVQIPASGAQFFLLLYLQMLGGGPTTTESCQIDYVRVYDQNLG